MEYDNNWPRARAYTRGAATLGQICDEIQRQPSGAAGVVVFRLMRDIKARPYRYRGLALFGVAVELPWLPISPELINDKGGALRLTWPQFAGLLPAAIAGAPAGLSCAVVFECAGVGLPRLSARDAKRAAALSALVATWPSDVQSLRAEWEPRRITARRSRYLAAADALLSALEFETVRAVSAV